MSIVSGIYKITFLRDGRIYIGSAADINKRWKWHKNSQVQLIGKMIKKHGTDAFQFEVIEEVPPNKKELEEKEQYYLDLLQPFPWANNQGFNLAPTAYTPLGIMRSESTKQKMRDSWDTARRNSEYLKKCSERIKGELNPAKRPEVAAKISAAMTGKTWKHDAERMKKHRAARVGRKITNTENMKLAQQKNKTRSASAKEKFYLAQRKLYQVTDPAGNSFQLYSRELKIFCIANLLTYANLITTAKTGKTYKGGWVATLMS